MDKEKQIKSEIRKLNKIFENIPEEKKNLVEGLKENAAFMRVQLKCLQEDVNENGAIITLKTGNGFEATKENPSIKNYSVMVGKYATIIKQLIDLLPEKDTNSDELLDCIGN